MTGLIRIISSCPCPASTASPNWAGWVLGGNRHYYPPLSSAATTFKGAEVSRRGVSKRGIGAIPDRSEWIMYTCARPYVKLANPGPISGNTQFTDHWDAFGHQDKPGCAPHA
jgi:hypothetical protein